MKKLMAFIALGVLFVLAVFGHTIAAPNTNFKLDSSYNINKDGVGSVSHTFTGKNTNAEKTPEVLKIPIAGKDASSVVAKVNDKDAPATVDESGATINVSLPNLTGKDKEWKLKLTYKSTMVDHLGDVKAVMLPTLDRIGLDISQQKTVVSAELGVGLAAALPEPTKTDIALGEQIFTYENKAGAVADTITLLFGDETTALMDITSELKNNGWWWKTIELTLPPDTNQQQVILSSLEPTPSNVRLDQDGNILAQYKLGPKKSVNVTAKAAINVRNISYGLQTETKLADINPTLAKLYTKLTDKWFGGRTEGGNNPVAPVAELTTKIYNEVVEIARNEVAIDDNTELSSAGINAEGKYAEILIGELRAAGIPARAVLGKLISDGQFILESNHNHVWAEGYIPDVGWVTLDPALAAYGDYLGRSDVLHVGLALWGVSDHLPPIDLNTVNVAYSDELAKVPEGTPELNSVKTVIFPGVSVMNTSVKMPAGVITDGNAVEYGGVVHALGSLAPLQTAQSKDFRFGTAAFGGEEVKYGVLNGEVLGEVVAQTNSTTSYTVLIIEAIALVLAIVIFIIWRRKRSVRKYKPSKASLIMHDEDDGGEVESKDLIGPHPIDDDKKPKPAPIIQPRPTMPETDTKPPVTHGTINPSNGGDGFQKNDSKNPRRHIIQ